MVSTLKWSQTNCAALPRVFSGLVYDLCVLNGPPPAEAAVRGPYINDTPFILFDIIASAVFDVVSLPYTVYSQAAHGNLELH
ncbi:YceK/YidQ family lipoprotein [Pseudomonas gregormendelii]